MSAPAFSVVVPTYRRGHLLPRAVASVLAQTWEDFELLVVDDASPDDGTEVALEAFSDPRLRLVLRRENGGAAATRNSGIEAARGRFVAFLDDDDEYLPRFLEKTYETFAAAGPEVALTWCGVRWAEHDAEDVRERDELWQPSYPSRHAAYLGFLRNRRIGTNCGLVFRRRALLDLGGFDTAFGSAEDTDLLIRTVREYDFAVVPETLIRIHLHAGERLRGISRYQADGYRRLLDKHRAALEQNPDLAAAVLYKAGWLHYHAGERRLGRSYLRRSLALKPWSAKPWMALLLHELLGRRAIAAHRWLSSRRRGRASLAKQPPGQEQR